MRIREIQARSIIVPTKLPDADVVVNPYVGCSFACGYCYASFMGRRVGETVEAWGDYVYVKTNAVTLFARELPRLQRRNPHSTLFMSSVTDAWQGPEKKYRLARGILEILVENRYPGCVSLLTKSPLIVRDLDLIAALPNAEVGVTITADSDDIVRELEARAPAVRRRFDVLRACNRVGIPTYAFLGPLLPHLAGTPAVLESLFEQLAAVGTTTIFAEHLNTSAYIRRRISRQLSEADPAVRSSYEGLGRDGSRHRLDDTVHRLVEQYGFRLRLGGVMDHHGKAEAALDDAIPQIP